MKDENINPSNTSMGPHVTNVCSSLTGEGMHYPLGGPRALCNAFASVVEQCGGKIVTGVPVQELVFEAVKEQKPKAVKKEGEEEEGEAPRCIGVKLSSGKTLTLTEEKMQDKSTGALVLSMHGFVHTFIRLMPEDVRIANKVPRGLPALSEQQPVFKVLFALKGSSEELDVTGADFNRLPGASLSMDEKDPSTGNVILGEVGSMIGDHKDTGKNRTL
jgi:phytoene dehydrogenase-like protein